jgi:hypothetical protein
MAIYPVEVEAHPTFQDGAFLEEQLYPGPLGPQRPARTGLWHATFARSGIGSPHPWLPPDRFVVVQFSSPRLLPDMGL